MKRSFAKDFLIISLGTFVNILISVISTPIITRLVDPSAYGQYSLLLTYGTIVSSLVIVGLDQALIRFYYESEEVEHKRSVLRFCFLVPLGLSCLIAMGILTWSFFSFSQGRLPEAALSASFVVYFVSFIFNTFSAIVSRVEFKSGLLSITTVLNKIAFVGFALTGILATSFDHASILVLATALAFFMVSGIRIYSDRHIWRPAKKSDRTSINRTEIIRYSIPVWVSSGVAILLQGIDKIGLDLFSDSHTLGIYASAFSLVNIFSIVQSSFNTLWNPTVTEHYAKDPQDTSFMVEGNNAISLVMFALGMLIIAFKDIFVLLLGPEYREAAQLVPYLIFIPIFYTISETTVSGVNLKKRTRFHVLISTVSLAVAVIAVFILTPMTGAKGTALAMAIAYITFFAIRTYCGNKCMPASFNLLKTLLSTLLLLAYSTWSTFASPSILMISLGVVGSVCVAIIYKQTTAKFFQIGIKKLESLRAH